MKRIGTWGLILGLLLPGLSIAKPPDLPNAPGVEFLDHRPYSHAEGFADRPKEDRALPQLPGIKANAEDLRWLEVLEQSQPLEILEDVSI